MDLFDLLIKEADSFVNNSKPDLALESVRKAQLELKRIGASANIHEATVACLLIDIGEQLQDAEVTQEGLTFLDGNLLALSKLIQLASLEYNIGNAKNTLYGISRIKNGKRFTPGAIVLLSEAKDHYWKALKEGTPTQLSKQLCVNLGNSLDSAGRLVEALFWYDQALLFDPAFGMAHHNRALALQFLNGLSGTFTISLIEEIRKSFTKAKTDPDLFPHLADQAQKRIESLQLRLQELGWDDEKIAEDTKLHEAEYDQHDEYWKFCLANHLALSEHGLYCKCVGALRDDLSIVKQSGPIAGDFVARLELLLNRIKSEFSYARVLYFQSLKPETKWHTDIYQSTFTELYEGEAIGIEEEFLRNSFRLCFGILDKIAQGLNELFSFAEVNETLYFESFWRPRGKKGIERWELINSQNNVSLVALFSLATDLNVKKGEWKFFKKYRNLMEHGLLVLLKDGSENLPAYILPERIQYIAVPIGEFKKHTIQMLQFTRSAIFSFAFCVRFEGQKELEKNKTEKAVKSQLNKKVIGKV